MQITEDVTLSRIHGDCILQVDSDSDVTVTLPNNLGVGFIVQIEQSGTGAAVLAAASGATIVSRAGLGRTNGQYAVIGAYVRSNANGITAEWLLTGAGAA
jgi:hypothetical protein